MNFPNKKYAVVYADPPWSYRQHGTGPKSRGNAEQHYHTMTTEDICALPVHQLAGGVQCASCGPHSRKLPMLCELWKRGALHTKRQLSSG
nr:MAG TPA: Transcriptional activator, adenine-specific DNA methyltransferase [Caudoviricetes sp.]